MTSPDAPPGLARLVRPADYVTLLNGLVGLGAILLAVQGRVHGAYALVLLAVLIDGADGAVARATGGGGPLGPKLDTLADAVCFVVAPAVLVWSAYDAMLAAWHPAWSVAVLAVAGLFLLMGLVRLARFDWLGGGARHDVFHGLTTPGAALVAVAGVLYAHQVDDAPAVRVTGLVLVAVAALLMASRRVLPKLRGPLAAPSVAVILVALGVGPGLGGSGPLLLLAFSVAYVVGGPAYARRRPRPDAASPGPGT